MNTPKASKLARPIILIILVVLLTGVIGFAVGGWSAEDQTPKESEITQESNNVQKPQEMTVNDTLPTVGQDYLTGLTIAVEEADVIPAAFLYDTASPAYGISYASVNIEIPVENGKTRCLCYIRETDKLGKVGSLAPSRSYITSVASAFGGTLIYAGFDDVIAADKDTKTLQKINVSGKSAYAYEENGKGLYTNTYMINTAVSDLGLRTSYSDIPAIPFLFSENTGRNGTQPAKTILLPYATDNKTEFVYDETSGAYVWKKNGEAVADPLVYGDIAYENVIVLFADATTYETIDYTETVLKTEGTGTGYYLSDGKYERITFAEDENGNLTFFDTAGRKLTVNPGKTYIGYFKSSQKSSVKIG